jgi:hypothetical protein
MVIGDENPLRQAEGWRMAMADVVRVPLWTVDADVIVPTALLETEQYAARTIRPRIHRQLATFLSESPEPKARLNGFATPTRFAAPATTAILDGLPLDRASARSTRFTAARARRAPRSLSSSRRGSGTTTRIAITPN